MDIDHVAQTTVDLAVRACTDTGHYGQVCFDATRTIAQAFAEAGFPAPYTPVAMRGGG